MDREREGEDSIGLDTLSCIILCSILLLLLTASLITSHHTYNTYLQYVPTIRTCNTYLHYIPTIHTCNTYLQYIPTIRTYNTYLQYIPTIRTCTYNTYLQYIPTIHTYNTYLHVAVPSSLQVIPLQHMSSRQMLVSSSNLIPQSHSSPSFRKPF